MEELEWPDFLDEETGIFRYYGDNREPGRALTDTKKKGNLILETTFALLNEGVYLNDKELCDLWCRKRTFLGFTHYCSKSKNGRFRVKRKTSKKKFAKKCREINQLMGHMKTWKLKEITAKLNQILTGYYHYYGITDNTERITAFRYHVMKSLFYCLNRRSQKKSYNWVEFLNMIDNSYPLVRPRIYVSVYN